MDVGTSRPEGALAVYLNALDQALAQIPAICDATLEAKLLTEKEGFEPSIVENDGEKPECAHFGDQA